MVARHRAIADEVVFAFRRERLAHAAHHGAGDLERRLAVLKESLERRRRGDITGQAHRETALRDIVRYFAGDDDPDLRPRPAPIPLPWP